MRRLRRGIDATVIKSCLRAVLFAMVLAGCSAHVATPSTDPPAPVRSSVADGDSSWLREQRESADVSIDDLSAVDGDGRTACPAWDSWRPNSPSPGITVTWWYEGIEPVTAVVQRSGGPGPSQTTENDPFRRWRDFEFSEVDPTSVTEVHVTSGTSSCYVRRAPA